MAVTKMPEISSSQRLDSNSSSVEEGPGGFDPGLPKLENVFWSIEECIGDWGSVAETKWEVSDPDFAYKKHIAMLRECAEGHHCCKDYAEI